MTSSLHQPDQTIPENSWVFLSYHYLKNVIIIWTFHIDRVFSIFTLILEMLSSTQNYWLSSGLVQIFHTGLSPGSGRIFPSHFSRACELSLYPSCMMFSSAQLSPVWKDSVWKVFSCSNFMRVLHFMGLKTNKGKCDSYCEMQMTPI